MKIRNGFVSNSSSSSFVVAFSHKPESAEELKKMMFPDKSWTNTVKIYDKSLTVSQVVEAVWADLKDQDEVDNEKLLNLFTHDWDSYNSAKDRFAIKKLRSKAEKLREEVDQYVESKIGSSPAWGSDNKEEQDAYYEKKVEFQQSDETYKKMWEKYLEVTREEWEKMEDLQRAHGEKQLSLFQDRVRGRFLALFHYEDNIGDFGAVMEHAGIFYNIAHKRFSHH